MSIDDGILNDVQRGAVFDRAARVEPFSFGKNPHPRRQAPSHAAKRKEWGIPNMVGKAIQRDGITASLAQKVQDWANTASQTLENMDLNKARVWSSRLSTLAQVVPAPAQIVTGKIDLDLGSLAEVLSNLRGNITQLGAMMEENQSQMKQAQSITNSTLKSDEQMISDVSEYIAFLQAGTQVLASGI